MKTKIKTKNEFQNPNLIFGNEIQKRKLKLKIDFYFWKKLLTIKIQYGIVFIEKTNLRRI